MSYPNEPWAPERRRYSYAEAMAYLQEAEHMTLDQLHDAKRSALADKKAGHITGDQCLAEAHLINTAIDLKYTTKGDE